jgi:hypothetical protein
MENDKALRDKIRPVMENMIYDLACEKPGNVVNIIFNKGSIYDQMVTEVWWLHIKWLN